MLLIGSQQMPGNGFPDLGIIALGAVGIALVLALNALLAGGGRLGFAIECGKQYGAGCKRQRKNGEPDKGFGSHGSISFRRFYTLLQGAYPIRRRYFKNVTAGRQNP